MHMCTESSYKVSEFNHVFEMYGRWFVYNTMYKSFAAIHESVGRDLTNNRIPVSLSTQRTLIEGAFVVSPVDEESRLSELSNWERDAHVLRVTVVPTFDCNFSCDYCFQAPYKGKETGWKTKTITEKISDLFRAGDYDQGAIEILGGEVLMYPEKLAQTLTAVRRTLPIPVSVRVTTNGTGLSGAIRAGFLDQADSVRVTLHRKYITTRRLQELLDVMREARDFKFVLRLNLCTNEDISFYKQLVQSLHCPVPDGVAIQLGVVMPTQTFERDGRVSLERERVIDLLEVLMKNCDKVEFCRNISSCSAKSSSAYVIDSSGQVYKCLNVAGIDRFALGQSETAYRQHCVETIPSYCGSCKWRPECNGGCLYVNKVS